MYFLTASGSKPFGLSSNISNKFFSMYSNTKYNLCFLSSLLHLLNNSPFKRFFKLNDVFLFQHAQHFYLSKSCLFHYFVFIWFLKLLYSDYTWRLYKLYSKFDTYFTWFLVLGFINNTVSSFTNNAYNFVLVHNI